MKSGQPDKRICEHRGLGLIVLCLLCFLLPPQLHSAPPTSEYKLKAALLYKLSKFVVWPETEAAETSGEFGICILGDDPFGEAMDILQSRKTGGKTIRIHRFAQSEAIDKRCQIVFIDMSKRAFLGSILGKLRTMPILTVADMRGFARQGGMMQFTRGAKRIEFVINPQSAQRSGLEIAAPLLELATVVETSTR